MTRPLCKLYVALFLGSLTLVSLSTLRGALNYQAPASSSVLDGGLAVAFERHYDEQLPVKDIGTNLWAALDYLLFHEGRPGVLLGTHGWLYSDEEFKPQPGERRNLRNNLALIRGVRAALARRNIDLVLAIVPAKARLYPEYLGAHHVDGLRVDLYQRFHAAMRRAGISAPDLLGPLLQAKAQGPVFLRTDTHWTPLGADTVAHQLGVAVQQALPLPGEPQTFVTETGEQVQHKGDLTRFLPLDPLFADLLPPPDRLQPHHTQVASSNASDAEALFAERELPVALVGTSYSANPAWNFAGALRQYLQRDLSNQATEGQGPIRPMLSYLQSDELNDAPPHLVIWEFPERYLPMASDLDDFDPAWLAQLKAEPEPQRLASSATR